MTTEEVETVEGGKTEQTVVHTLPPLMVKQSALVRRCWMENEKPSVVRCTVKDDGDGPRVSVVDTKRKHPKTRLRGGEREKGWGTCTTWC